MDGMENKKGDKMEYPNLTVSADELPAIKDWKVGQTYTVKVSVKMLTYNDTHKTVTYSGEGGAKAGFKILNVESADDKTPPMMTPAEHKTYIANEKMKAAKSL